MASVVSTPRKSIMKKCARLCVRAHSPVSLSYAPTPVEQTALRLSIRNELQEDKIEAKMYHYFKWASFFKLVTQIRPQTLTNGFHVNDENGRCKLLTLIGQISNDRVIDSRIR